MRLSTGMKVGLVSLFTCLALLLGQLSSTSMALAYTANTSQSANISSIADATPLPGITPAGMSQPNPEDPQGQDGNSQGQTGNTN